MERALQDEGAIYINYKGLEHGSAEKSSETSPRKNYVGSPATRYGFAASKTVSASGVCGTTDVLGQDSAMKHVERLQEKEWRISSASLCADSSKISSMRHTSDSAIHPDEENREGTSETSPKKSYWGAPSMRYRASSETQPIKASTDKTVLMSGASKTTRLPDQGSDQMTKQISSATSYQNTPLSATHASSEEISAPTPDKSLQEFFSPRKCPHPYVGLNMKEPVEEKQEPLNDVREKVQQQVQLEKEAAKAFTQGDCAKMTAVFTRLQRLDTDIQSQIFEQINADMQYANVMRLLRSLADEYSKQSFQFELQKLLIEARKLQKHTNGSRKIVPGRCELCRSIEEEVLASISIPKTSTTSVWRMIGNFAHDKEVTRYLSVLDELLALPPSSNLKVALDCRISGCSAKQLTLPGGPSQSVVLQNKQKTLRVLPCTPLQTFP